MPTNFVRGSYQEIIDLQTQHDKVSVIGLHTPTGSAPYALYKPFFDAYRQYHYDGMSISLVPSATLPADIEQVSYGAGEPPVDPRDILNPIMFKGCHGEDMGVILNQMINGPSPDAPASLDMLQREVFQSGEISSGRNNFYMGKMLENLYYKALTDKTWAKAHPQRGFRKSGMHPLVYDVSANIALPPGSSLKRTGSGSTNTLGSNTVTDERNGVNRGGTIGADGSGNVGWRFPMGDMGVTTENTQTGQVTFGQPVTRNGVQLFTSRMKGLGWLDTRVRYHVPIYGDHQSSAGDVESIDNAFQQQMIAANATHVKQHLPLLYMGIILLPPSYKATQSFRLIINHRFSWRGFRPISLQDPEGAPGLNADASQWETQYYNYNKDYSSKSAAEVGNDDESRIE